MITKTIRIIKIMIIINQNILAQLQISMMVMKAFKNKNNKNDSLIDRLLIFILIVHKLLQW